MKGLLKRISSTALLALLLPLSGVAQITAAFPSRVATDQDTLLAANKAQSNLVQPLTSSATNFQLISASSFKAPGVVTIDNEIIWFCSIQGNLVYVCPGGRGYDNTFPAFHAAGTQASGLMTAYHHNRLGAEIKAIETALGPGLGNVMPASRQFNFSELLGKATPQQISVFDAGLAFNAPGGMNLQASTTTFPSLVIPPGTAPSSPTTGALWNRLGTLNYFDGATTRPLVALDKNGAATMSALYPRTSVFVSFGDSISTCATPSSQLACYVDMLGVARGVPPLKLAVGGQMAADQADFIYPTTVPSSGFPFYTYMIGTNDNNIYGQGANNQAIFQAAHQAELVWLALPETRKIRAQSAAVTYTGSWANSTYYGGALGKVSTTLGSTASFNTYGTTAYVAVTLQDGNTGSFTVAIDGGSPMAFNAASGGTIRTQAGRTYTPYLLRFPYLADGAHWILLTVTSATGANNKVWFDWAAGNQGLVSLDGPQVYAAGVPRQHGGYPDANIFSYSNLVKQNVSALAADGLPVVYVDTTSAMDPSTGVVADGVHPNDSGHAQIYQAFLAAMQALPTAADRGNAAQAAKFTGQSWFQPNYQLGCISIGSGSCPGAFAQLVVAGSYFGQVLIKGVGNAAGITADTTTPGQQSFLSLSDQGVGKWQLVKNVDNSFSIWDQANSKAALLASSGNVLLTPTAGKVGIGIATTPNTLLNIGAGTPTTAAYGIQFGTDATANLYRLTAGVIKTDGSFQGGHKSAGGGVGITSASCSSWTDGLCTNTGYTVTAALTGTCNTIAGPPYTVTSTGGTNNFSSVGVGLTLAINGSYYQVVAVADATHITVNASPGALTGVTWVAYDTVTTSNISTYSGVRIVGGNMFMNGAGLWTGGSVVVNNGGQFGWVQPYGAGFHIGDTNVPWGSLYINNILWTDGTSYGTGPGNSLGGMDTTGKLTVFNQKASTGSSSVIIQAGAGQSTNPLLSINSNGTTNMMSVGSNGAVYLAGSTGAAMTRPAVGATRIAGEIAGVYPVWTQDDGFLRLSAGGGTGASYKSYIDLTGWSTVPDMLRTITFGTGGAERMRIDTNGYVGIGTTSPNFRTEIAIAGVNTTPTALRLTNTASASVSAGQGVTLGFANDVGWGLVNSATITSLITTTGNGASALAFGTYNGTAIAERMRIDGAGNVGIGTTAPATALDIFGGGLYLNSNTSYQIVGGGKAIQVRDPATAYTNLISDANADGAILGAYMFSRSAAQADAHVNVAGIQAVQVGTGTGAGARLKFFTKNGAAAAANMLLDSNGYLGIGTGATLPATLLNIGANAVTGAANGIQFSNDSLANLYRWSAGYIKTDGNLNVGGSLSVTSTIYANSWFTTNLPAPTAGTNYTHTVWSSGGTARWDTILLSAETGASAGSDWSLNRHNDAGAWVSSVLVINRATGYIGISNASPNVLLTIGPAAQTTAAYGIQFGTDAGANLYRSGASVLKTDGNFTASGMVQGLGGLGTNIPTPTAGNNRIHTTWQSSGVNRWSIFLNNPESGSNTGSDFAIISYNDAGVYMATPLYFTRSNNGAQFAGTVMAGGGYKASTGAAGVAGSACATFVDGLCTVAGSGSGLTGTTGASNTSLGTSAFNGTSTGTANVAVGVAALNASTNGNNNSALGYNSLGKATGAGSNTAIGYQALYNNLTGNNNTAVGANALLNATSSGNTAVGTNALQTVGGSGGNTALGFTALQATNSSNNTGVGYAALNANVNGTGNSALGYNAMLNQTGGNNTGIGASAFAGGSGADGNYNSALGSGALANALHGNSNTAVGYNALASTNGSSQSLGAFNSALGVNALYSNTSGTYNAAFGHQAGYPAGANGNVSGTNNTWLGANSGSGTSAVFTYQTAIGSDALASCSSCVVLGRASDNVGVGTKVPLSTARFTIGSPSGSDATLGPELATGTWTSTGWTGAAVPFTHTTGNVSALTLTSFAPVVGSYYQVTVSTTRTIAAGTIATTLGGVVIDPGTYYLTGGAGWTHGIKATTTGNLIITPTTDFDGVVTVSVKLVTPATTYGLALLDSSGGTSATFSQRSAGTKSFFIGGGGLYEAYGFNSMAIGLNAMQFNVSGINNTAIGALTLQNNLSGDANTAIGMNTLVANTSGSTNTAVGAYTMTSNTSGGNNVAIGSQSLQANTTGTNNTAIGSPAMSHTNTGTMNVGIGTGALDAQTTAQANTAIGFYAGSALTTASSNTLIGDHAMFNGTSYQNTAIGQMAMAGTTSGNNNVAVGYLAGGWNTGNYNSTGSNNVWIGAGTQPAGSPGGTQYNYQTVIGAGATAACSNCVVLGRSSDALVAPGAVSTPASSSASCSAGQVAFDSSYAYFCTAANTWKRAAIATW